MFEQFEHVEWRVIFDFSTKINTFYVFSCIRNICFLAAGGSSVLACGIDWTLPNNRFAGVDEQGYVSYWAKASEIDIGAGLKLPLNVNFKSNNDRVSQYLGYGWTLPLLECRFVQIGENQFYLLQPDGWMRLFWRQKTTDLILTGAGGWTAEITGLQVKAWANCGWSMIFLKGKIQSIKTPQNRTLEYIYSGDKLLSLNEQGHVIIAIKYADQGFVDGLQIQNANIAFKNGLRPRVMQVSDVGRKVVGYDRCVTGIVIGSVLIFGYEYGVDDVIEPTLSITARNSVNSFNHVFKWDAESKLILQDNDWVYSVSPNTDRDASISRSNRITHQKDEIKYLKDSDVVFINNGSNPLRYVFFKDPKNAGQIREIYKSDVTGERLIYKRKVDENGDTISEFREGVTYTYKNRTIIAIESPQHFLVEFQAANKKI